MTLKYTVLGAGSVGISTALQLQQRGLCVDLIDQQRPATATSYGNAGVVNNCSFIPINNPSLWKNLPGLLLNQKPQLRYKLSYLLRNSSWLFHFLKSTGSKQTYQTANSLAALLSGALDEHKALMQRVGNMRRLSESGWLKIYREEPKQVFGPLENDLYQQNAITIDLLDKNDIYDLEPQLKPVFRSGYLLKDSTSVNNPSALLNEYFEDFLKHGGTFHQQEINSISRSASGFELETSERKLQTDVLVVCLGPWSGKLLETMGYKVNLGVERGYHQHFTVQSDGQLSRPIHDINAGYILAPMEQGLRLTTGVELNHRDAQPNYSQLNQVIPRAREAINLGPPTEDPIWMGCRPTFPDSLPVIDNAPDDPDLWLAFGHQHIGLMSGPVTGKLLVQKLMGDSTDIDLQPFRAERWIKAGN